MPWRMGVLYPRRCGEIMVLLGLIILSTMTRSGEGYPTFQTRIPNGEMVPHPCKANHLWSGVGHLSEEGYNARNPFGRDFYNIGNKRWTVELCNMDSDGDGMSNGVELGDPDCTWTPESGKLPDDKARSHPGVCEPIQDPKCQALISAEDGGNWNFCEVEAFECDALNNPDVISIKMNINADTPVPSTETSYFCQVFDIPKDQDYHLIGSTPELDNVNVAHHILIFGCDDTPEANAALDQWKTPGVCGMQATSGACTHGLIAGWTVGKNGDCMPPEVGLRVGKSGIRRALMQIHWNNPEKKDDFTDGSGLTIYLTNIFRPNDMGTLTIGKFDMTIPPRLQYHEETGTCSEVCTGNISTINVFGAGIHMHYQGVSGALDLYRSGKKVASLIDRSSFSYDSPEDQLHDPPIQISSRDELKITCGFKTTNTDTVTYHGDATSDEMCLAFVKYYPKIPLTSCGQMDGYYACNPKTNIALVFEQMSRDGCNVPGFIQNTFPGFTTGLADKCSSQQCTPECEEYLDGYYKNEICFQIARRTIENFILRNGADGLTVVARMRACDLKIIQLEMGTANDEINASGVITPGMIFIGVFIYHVSKYL